MIPEWLGNTAAKIIVGLAGLAIVVGILALAQCQRARTAATETKLATGQAGAALNSGVEAVDVVGNRQAAEQAGADNVQEAQHAIDNATDAGGVTDAALAGLRATRRRAAPGRGAGHPVR